MLLSPSAFVCVCVNNCRDLRINDIPCHMRKIEDLISLRLAGARGGESRLPNSRSVDKIRKNVPQGRSATIALL